MGVRDMLSKAPLAPFIDRVSFSHCDFRVFVSRPPQDWDKLLDNTYIPLGFQVVHEGVFERTYKQLPPVQEQSDV